MFRIQDRVCRIAVQSGPCTGRKAPCGVLGSGSDSAPTDPGELSDKQTRRYARDRRAAGRHRFQHNDAPRQPLQSDYFRGRDAGGGPARGFDPRSDSLLKLADSRGYGIEPGRPGCHFAHGCGAGWDGSTPAGTFRNYRLRRLSAKEAPIMLTQS